LSRSNKDYILTNSVNLAWISIRESRVEKNIIFLKVDSTHLGLLNLWVK